MKANLANELYSRIAAYRPHPYFKAPKIGKNTFDAFQFNQALCIISTDVTKLLIGKKGEATNKSVRKLFMDKRVH